MSFRKKFFVLMILLSSLFLIGKPYYVRAEGFDDIDEIPLIPPTIP